MLEQLDFTEVRETYDRRLNVHQLLLKHFSEEAIEDYVLLALGISNPAGNYSANEWSHGPEILNNNLAATIHRRVFNLATEIYRCAINHVPRTIYQADINNLKISVGSEMGMMLRPDDIWVGNVRTYWVHMLINNDWNVAIANEAVGLFRDNERDADMEYRVWRDVYLATEKSLSTLTEQGNIEAKNQGVEPGKNKFMWADAISTSLYRVREDLV